MRAEEKNVKDLERTLMASQERIKSLEAELLTYKSTTQQNGLETPANTYQIDYAFCPKAILNQTGEINYINKRFEQLVGPFEKLKGKSIETFVPDLNYTNTKVQQTDKTDIIFKKLSDLNVKSCDGDIIPIEAGLAFIQKPNQLDIILTIIDITERRKIEKSLLKTIERLDLSLSGGNIGVWDWDIENNDLFWDESMYKMYELDKAQFGEAYDAWTTTIHPDDRMKTETAVQNAIDGGPPFVHEFRIITGNDQIKYIHAHASVIHDENGMAQRMVGVNRDISNEKKTYNKLLNSQIQLKAFFDLAPIGIARNDMEGKFIETNSEFERFTGYTTDELNNLSYWHLTPHEYEEQEKVQLESLKSTGKYGPYKKEYIHKDGYRYPVLLHGQIIESPDGDDNIWSTVLDLTEIERTNKKLSRSLEQLTQTNDELKRFAYVASHDLQEPLRVITSYLQLVEMNSKEALDEKSNQYIQRAHEAAKRMRTLIVDLLSLSRVDDRRLEVSEVELSTIISTVTDDLSLAIKQSGAQLHIPDNLPTIHADAGLMQNVFQNLLSNALKFSRPDIKPIIEISCKELKNEYHLSVTDNGIGIDKKYNDRIFEIFQRLHTRDDYTGNGIGLSIVKKIVNIHGGKIWFDSTANKGTTFTLTLPKNPQNE